MSEYRPGFSIETAPGDASSPTRFVVSAETAEAANLAKRALDVIGAKARVFRDANREQRIERLVEALIEGEPLSPVEQALETDNAEMRARYLEIVPTLTAADVHREAGSRAGNRSALASSWKHDGRVFAVPHRGSDRFPAFQFSGGQPHPVIRRVLTALPGDMTPWQVALWFASGNGWLDGAAPQDRLDVPDAVVAAAGRLREPAVG